jgi:hypothetical protein
MRPIAKCLKAVGILIVAAALSPAALGVAKEKTESFDSDPNWDHSNNRPADRGDEPVTVRQDFGYSATSHAGGERAGEIGGFVFAAAEPAWYGKVVAERTLEQPLSASGTFSVADGGTNLLLGFFNANTSKEWRTPNTLALRINGRGDHFFAYLEYCTSKWRAGADSPRPFPTKDDPRTGRKGLVGFPGGGRPHRWELCYDPAGNNGGGAITATIDGVTSVCHLDAGHKADGAVFNRFGILNVMKSADSGGEFWVDDLTINGESDRFDADPKWDGRGNRVTFTTHNVRPRFDFGFSPRTNFAGGKAAGEMGGLFFRGDCRYPKRLAYYGDRVGPLTLDGPIRARGKVALRRGVSDSTTLLGFFNAAAAMRVNPSQDQALPEGVIGINVEGPSSEGFCFYPVMRVPGRDGAFAPGLRSVRILPDGAGHDWAFDYDPAGAGGRGRITVALDGKSIHLDLTDADRRAGATFDHFGLVTPWIDGNGQVVYFDDVTYGAGQ